METAINAINSEKTPIKFQVCGLITAESFQKCRYIVNKLRLTFPKIYEVPELRPMLNVEWEEYVLKMKRNIPIGHKFWQLQRNCTVFCNSEFIGDDNDLVVLISAKFRFGPNRNWEKIGRLHLIEYLNKILASCRHLVYLTIAVNKATIGTMLFELYSDLVPRACENFLNRCKMNEAQSYAGTPIHRIVKNSWIQIGGWNLQENKMPCENYVVPHNRRGLLCTTNNGRHKANSTQFFITLAPTAWMDYRYVAFGQLLQGAEVLSQIEKLKTYREAPIDNIEIIMCGEYSMLPEKIEMTDDADMEMYIKLNNLMEQTQVSKDTLFSKSKCYLETDKKSYLPFMHLPDKMMAYLKHFEDHEENKNKEVPIVVLEVPPLEPRGLVMGPCGLRTPPPTPVDSRDSFRIPYFDKYTKGKAEFMQKLKRSDITI